VNDEATAERLGLSPYDLVMLAAEECGLIPVGHDDDRDWLDAELEFERRMDR